MDYRAGRWKGSRQPNSEQKTGNKSGKILIDNVRYHFQPIFSKEVSDYGGGMCWAIPSGCGDAVNGQQSVFGLSTPARQPESLLKHG